MSGYVFDYTTGDPDNLTGGGDASMTDIQGSFFDLRTWLNSGVLQQLAASLYIVGEVRHLAGPPPDATWIPCDGRSLTQSGNVKLFNAIGTTYGPGAAPGSTFAVPDLRGRAVIGTGTGDAVGATAHPAGIKAGEETHVLTAAESGMRAHTHPESASNVVATLSNAAAGANFNVSNAIGGNTGDANISGASGAAHNNLSPSLPIPAYIYAGT